MRLHKMMIVFLLLSLIAFGVTAQDAAETPTVGADDVCGEAALDIIAVDNTPNDADIDALDDLLRRFVTVPGPDEVALSVLLPKPPAPGAVIFVDSPAGSYFRGTGVADVETCEPIDPTAPFAIGSHTKMFTAGVIFQLQEEGLLATDDLVSAYLPDEIALFDGAESVTIDMLLTHTSGLPDYFEAQGPASIGALDTDPESGELERAFAPQELIEFAAADPLTFEPGAEGQWSYSNTGYIMLGLVIEQVTGQSYNDAVTERIIEPLGLENTFPVAEFAPDDIGLPSVYLTSPFTYDTSGWNFTQAYSAGNIISTPEDMAVFLRAYYTGGLFDDPATLDLVLERAAPGYVNESDNFYYFHGGNYKQGFLGHGGQTLGTISDAGYNPEFDVVIVSWANTSEAYTGQAVFHVGNVLGLTPSWDEVLIEIQTGGVTIEEPPTASIEEVTGITFALTTVIDVATDTVLTQDEITGTYTVTFNVDGTMSIVVDCNTVTATYTTGEANALTIDLGASTLAACPEGSLSDEVLRLLASTMDFRTSIVEGEISISLFSPDDSVLVFAGSQ